MNIIANTCVGSYLYRDFLHRQYDNPFCWCTIDAESIIKLIKNYNEINFTNIDLLKQNDNTFSIKIDNHVLVNYVHYKYDPNCTIPTAGKNGDIFYNRNYEYVYEKYTSRIKRMTDKPTFILQNITLLPTNKNMLIKTKSACETLYQQIIDLNTNYDIIIIQPDFLTYNLKNISDNIKIINHNNYTNTQTCANTVYDQLYKNI